MSSAGRRIALIALVGAAVAGALAAHPGLAAGVLHLAPAIGLLLLLALGRYVGERQIARLAGRRFRRPAARIIAAPACLRARARVLARGGALLGASLAVRPPPVALASA
ncbi:MAG: hypothetical protein QOJ21_98 [Solirubrobacteraceae bacterium]|nr:hypothetical protein [Solirubrobacteraceae bacterium]